MPQFASMNNFKQYFVLRKLVWGPVFFTGQQFPKEGTIGICIVGLAKVSMHTLKVVSVAIYLHRRVFYNIHHCKFLCVPHIRYFKSYVSIPSKSSLL